MNAMTQTKAAAPRDPKIRCPNCGGAAKVMTGYNITPTYREITYQCQSEPCFLRFVAALSPVREIIASGAPRPGFRLPRAKPDASNDPP